MAICSRSPTPTGPTAGPSGRYERRGLWLAPTWEGMVAIDGLLEPEAGQTLLAALEPLARPADAARRPQRRPAHRPMPWPSWPAATWRAGRLPQTGGVRPQLLVTVDLDSLLGRPGAVGGDAGWRPARWPPRRVGGWPVTAR